MNFIDFSVIYVSQGSVATYVRCGGMSTDRCIPTESVSERIFKIDYDLTKLLPKVWWLPFFGTQCSLVRSLMLLHAHTCSVHLVLVTTVGQRIALVYCHGTSMLIFDC